MRISDWSSDVCASARCEERRSYHWPSCWQACALEKIVFPRHRQRCKINHQEEHQRCVVGISFSRFRENLRRNLLKFERSEEHTSELQSLMRISYAVFRLTK